MAIYLNDLTSNGNNLNNSGATEVTTSLPFSASRIAIDLESGSSQYVYAGDSPSLSLSTTGTLECWVKYESTPSSGNYFGIISKYSSPNESYRLIIYNDGGTLKYQGEVSGDGSTTHDTYRWTLTPSVGTWYHLALTINTSNASATTFELFLDGSSQGNGTAVNSDNVATIYDGTAGLEVGVASGNFFDGVIDDVRIWNVVRTGTEITNNKSVRLVGNETGLVAYWPFEPTLSGFIPFF